MVSIQGDEMEYMGLYCNVTLTTDIVRVMARVRKVELYRVKTDWEMVRRTLVNCREEGTMRLQEVVVGNRPSDNIKTEKGVTIK